MNTGRKSRAYLRTILVVLAVSFLGVVFFASRFNHRRSLAYKYSGPRPMEVLLPAGYRSNVCVVNTEPEFGSGIIPLTINFLGQKTFRPKVFFAALPSFRSIYSAITINAP